MYYLLLIFIVILSILLLFFGISTLFSIYGGIVYVFSGKKNYEKALEEIKPKPDEIFYELGSGFGYGLIYASSKYKIQSIGYEISPFHYIISKLRIINNKNISIRLADFRNEDLSKADVLYCYLSPALMKQLSFKFAKELKNSARVISIDFKLPNKKPSKILKNNKKIIYIYKY